jgi:hypothetical protein
MLIKETVRLQFGYDDRNRDWRLVLLREHEEPKVLISAKSESDFTNKIVAKFEDEA